MKTAILAVSLGIILTAGTSGCAYRADGNGYQIRSAIPFNSRYDGYFLNSSRANSRNRRPDRYGD
jgi:hypothetical protein